MGGHGSENEWLDGAGRVVGVEHSLTRWAGAVLSGPITRKESVGRKGTMGASGWHSRTMTSFDLMEGLFDLI